MQGVSVLLFLGILAKWSCGAVYLNNRPFPTYSLENMPDTQFSCREKILGGYYADPDTQCQMFHVCVKVAGVGVQDFRFLCPNGTAFDQDHQICADWEDVDCDATTLYYSSDNFDLYRVGSGFESKAHRYGEDEETFALQRAETGDARINREPQTQTVNQQKEYQRPQPRKNYNNYNSQDKDIFKASSSSNFFNNRNNGKETDEDYDDNVNINQNRDYEQKRKVVRKQHRRPVQQNGEQNEQGAQTRRPQRPTGFANNFAGSSYIPTTQRSETPSANNDQFTTFRSRGRQRNNNNSPTPTYTISTPAPFRHRQSTQNDGQYHASSTENYPQPRPTSAAPKQQQTENYPSNNPQYAKPTTPFASFDKKPTSPKKLETYKPTTFSPNAKPFSIPSTQNVQGLPTTFAPRTQQAFTQIAQQTSNYNAQKSQNPSSTTQKATTFTQYTPTVPKVTSTTPVARSNRFDETQYDDGSYDPKYDYNNNSGGEDEFLKTAHSQNIASSRNELAKAQKQQPQPTTTTRRPYTENYPKSSPRNTQVTQRPVESKLSSSTPGAAVALQPTGKKVKDVSYDYAYYDSLGPEPDYHIDTEIKKASSKN